VALTFKWNPMIVVAMYLRGSSRIVPIYHIIIYLYTVGVDAKDEGKRRRQTRVDDVDDSVGGGSSVV